MNAFCTTSSRRLGLLWWLFALYLLLVSGGCSRALVNDWHRHATFLRTAYTAPPDAHTVRVLLDWQGDLYPKAELLPHQPTAFQYDGASLEDYYKNTTVGRQLFPQLATHYTGHEQEATSEGWFNIQSAIAESLAQSINSKSAVLGAAPLPVVLLIHGYNEPEVGLCDDGLRARYDSVRHGLETARPALANAVYVEVYWDGLQKSEDPGLREQADVWGSAQTFARYCGLGLRQVISKITADRSLYVFTHSTGAVVATHTFWNVNSDQAPGPDKDAINEWYRRLPPPAHANVRMGLLAPATPGNVFLDATDVGGPALLSTPRQFVVIGYNPLDYALWKKSSGTGRGGTGHGATGAGCRSEDLDAFLDAFGAKGAFVNLCTTPKKPTYAAQDAAAGGIRRSSRDRPKEYTTPIPPWRYSQTQYEKHSWGLYTQRPNFTQFVQLVVP